MGLYIALQIAVSVPYIQHYIAKNAEKIISNTIGARVCIGTIRIESLNNARIDSLVLFDQQGKQMITVDRIDGAISLLDLWRGVVCIKSLKVVSGTISVYKKNEKLNCQFLIDSLAPKQGGEKKLRVELKSLLIKDLQCTYQDCDKPLSGILALIRNDRDERCVSGIVKTFSCVENRGGGIRIRNLNAYTHGGLSINHFQGVLHPAASQSLSFGSNSAGKNTGSDPKPFLSSDESNILNIRRLSIKTRNDIHLYLRDSYIKYAPKLTNLEAQLNLSCNNKNAIFPKYDNGGLSNYTITINGGKNIHSDSMPVFATVNVLTGNGRSLMKADLQSSQNIKEHFILDLYADIQKPDVRNVFNLLGKRWSDSEWLEQTDNIKLNSHFEASNDKVSVKGNIDAGWINIKEDITLHPHTASWKLNVAKLSIPDSIFGKQTKITNADFSGELFLPGYNIIDFIKNIGRTSGTEAQQASKSTITPKTNIIIPKAVYPLRQIMGQAKGNVDLNIAAIKFGDSFLTNAKLKAGYNNKILDVLANATLSSPESNTDKSHGNIAAKGILYDPFGEARLEASARIKDLNLNYFGIEKSNYIPQTISADILVSAHNVLSVPDEYKISLKDFNAISHTGVTTHISHFLLSAKTTGTQSLYEMDGDLGTGYINTNLSLSHLVPVMRQRLYNHFPALASTKNGSNHLMETSNAYCRAQLSITDSRLLSNLIYKDISFLKPAVIEMNLNEIHKGASLIVSLPSFWYGGTPYQDASIYLGDKGDSIVGAIMLTRSFGNTPVRIENHFSGEDNNLRINTVWKNMANGNTRGNLNTSTLFTRNKHGLLSVHTDVLPTNMYIQDTLWQISHANINYDDDKFDVKDLIISRGDQFASLSAQRHKDGINNVRLQLNDIEIAYLLDLVDFDPVRFSGRVSGLVSGGSEYGTSNLVGNLSVREFCFNSAYLGRLKATTLWDNSTKHLTFDAHAQATPSDSTLISGDIGIGENTLDIQINSEKTNLQFLNKYIGRFMNDVEGNVSGWYRVFGTFHNVQMEANERINLFRFRPKITGVLYTIKDQDFRIRPDTIDFSGLVATDPYNNKIELSGSLNHHYLRRFNYDFSIVPHNAMILDWANNQDNSFWGTFYARGHARIHGNFNEVNIDGELTTAGNEGKTVINYNSEASSSNNDERDYIRFISPQEKYSNTASRSYNTETVPIDDGTDVRMDIKLNATPEATLNIITDPVNRDNLLLHGRGPLRLEYYNKGRFDLSGLYSIVGGTYNLTIKDIIRKNFEIQPDGYLRFNGNLDDGDINLKGINRINSVSLSDLNVGASQSNSTIGVDCILNFTGKTSNPKVSFDLDFPQANADENILLKKFILTEEDRNLQAVYLLSIGRFYTYNYDTFSSASGSQSQGANAMSSFLAGTLSGQVNNILQDALHIQNWNFGTNIATGRQGFNDMEVQGTLSGRMFNNRMLFNGNFGYRDQMTTYSNNFVGDFNLQWFLNKAGTISLKAYSETNDRYFTKSSLTTQGGGILFQKDFNRLSNFFRRTK